MGEITLNPDYLLSFMKEKDISIEGDEIIDLYIRKSVPRQVDANKIRYLIRNIDKISLEQLEAFPNTY